MYLLYDYRNLQRFSTMFESLVHPCKSTNKHTFFRGVNFFKSFLRQRFRIHTWTLDGRTTSRVFIFTQVFSTRAATGDVDIIRISFGVSIPIYRPPRNTPSVWCVWETRLSVTAISTSEQRKGGGVNLVLVDLARNIQF